MKPEDPSGDAGEAQSYREATFVARPDEAVRAGDRGTEASGGARDEAGEEAEERVEQLREAIEETRSELSETVEAIQEKLKPAALAEQAKEQAKETIRDATEQAKESVYDATVGRAEHVVSGAGHTAKGIQMTIMDTIRGNPVAAAAAGLSLGWLWMNRPKDQDRGYVYRDRAGEQYGSDYSQQHSPGGYYGQGGGYNAGGRTPYTENSDRGGGITDKVGDAAGAVRDRAGGVASAAGDMAGDAWSGARGVAGTAGGTATDLTSTLVETVTRNPLPAALTGIGLAWLWMSRSSDADRPYYAHSGGHYWQGNAEYSAGYEQPGGLRAVASGVQDQTGRVAGGVKDTAGQVAGGVAGAAGQARDAAGSVAGTVADTAGDVASTVVGRAEDFAGGVQYRARRTGTKLQDLLDENPLLVGAMAVAAGLVVGLAAPSTERERELMGEARETVAHRAKEAVQETVDKAKQVAGAATGAAQEAAKESAQESKQAQRPRT